MTLRDRIEAAAADAVAEALKAASQWPEYRSCHEGLGILLEEFSKVQAEIFRKQEHRNLTKLRAELVQVAAVSLRIIVDVIDGGRGMA